MESPVVRRPPRPERLIRDYSSEDDPSRILPPRNNDRNPPDRIPHAPDLDGTASSRNNTRDTRSYGEDGRQTRFRMRSPDPPEARPRSLSQASMREYQDATASHAYPVPLPAEDLHKLDFALESIDENLTEPATTSYAPSISSVGDRSAVANSSTSRLPEFFSAEVFQVVLHNPTTAHQLLKFSQKRLCGENMEFLEKVDRYHTLLNDVAKTLFEIHRDFITVTAPGQINIDSALLIKVNKDLKTSLSHTLPKLESVFVDPQNDIERLVFLDTYPRFVRHQLTMSATRALATDKSRYAGLGDCFVLTDPAKADNPIVYASDGFVKVTGYPRSDIIPRNCRFLQCRHTDRSVVKRLKMAIDKREESVELLLNQKKDGEPFWNLLYTTPLFDNRGNVVFFLGGQINCSTTIHSQSDMLKMLAMSDDVEEKDTPPQATTTPAATAELRSLRPSKLFSAFRSPEKRVQPRKEAGMEGDIVRGMESEKMDLKMQMDVFYTAYSKFLVVNASTMFISFHSAGIIDLLYPAQARSTPFGATASPSPAWHSNACVAGQDVFKFLAQHSSSTSLPSGFKSKVRDALKRGSAISVDLTLCTRRYMGFRKFAVHWTPLKDAGGKNGEGEVGWVIVTLGGDVV